MHAVHAVSGLNSLGLAKPVAETRVVVAMSGGVDSSVVAAHARGRGLRGDRRHPAALRPRRRAGAQGRLLRRARHPRRAPGRRERWAFRTTCSTTRAGFATRSSTSSPTPTSPARRRFPASAATSGSSSATCSRPRAISAPTAWPPVTMFNAHPPLLAPELHRAADPDRDQSYFLFSTTREQLDYLRFPLGNLRSKAETRALAARYGLAVAEKPDSQDICFVPNGSYAAVIEKLRPGRGGAGRDRRPRRAGARRASRA